MGAFVMAHLARDFDPKLSVQEFLNLPAAGQGDEKSGLTCRHALKSFFGGLGPWLQYVLVSPREGHSDPDQLDRLEERGAQMLRDWGPARLASHLMDVFDAETQSLTLYDLLSPAPRLRSPCELAP